MPSSGGASVEHLREDLAAADGTLSPDVIARADDLINEKTVHGNRYNDQSRSEVDTEAFRDRRNASWP